MRALLQSPAAAGAAQQLEPIGAAVAALLDGGAWGSVISNVRAAMRTASSMRERLSADFWALLVGIENGLADAGTVTSEAEVLRLTNRALQTMA